MALLWVTKTSDSKSLSRSDGDERAAILFHAHNVSRQKKAAQERRKGSTSNATGLQSAIVQDQHHGDASLTCDTRRSCRARGLCGRPLPCYRAGTNLIHCKCQSSLGIVPSMQMDTSWTAAERRSAIYFQEVAVHKILTWRRDKQFWKGIVPATAEFNTGIRHLMIAIAATHELLFQLEPGTINTFALTQCNKALQTILASKGLERASLTTSCILVTAYNLLRGNIDAADKSVQSGLSMLASTDIASSDDNTEHQFRVLKSLDQQHGFKLWSVDVNFQIDKIVVGREDCLVFAELPRGPFTDIDQVLAAFKVIMMEFVAKTMRNVALGTLIDPTCSFARDLGNCISQSLSYWKSLYDDLVSSAHDERLRLIQLKIGLLLTKFLFHVKLLAADELEADAHIAIVAEILQLGQTVVAARHVGRSVVYLDRIVNSALFMCSIFCREPTIRRQLITLLKRQLPFENGLVNFLRGCAAEVVADIEEHGLTVGRSSDIPEAWRIGICSLDCWADRILLVGYMSSGQTERSNLRYHQRDLSSELANFDREEVDECIRGMTTAHKMYRKQELSKAPRGYLREMHYNGVSVKVLWRYDTQRQQDSHCV